MASVPCYVLPTLDRVDFTCESTLMLPHGHLRRDSDIPCHHSGVSGEILYGFLSRPMAHRKPIATLDIKEISVGVDRTALIW